MNKIANYINDMKCVDTLPNNILKIEQATRIKPKKNQGFLIIPIKAMDPFSAINSATILVETTFSLYRLYDHTFRYSVSTEERIAFDGSSIYKFNRNVMPVEHTRKPSAKKMIKSMETLEKAILESSDSRNSASIHSLFSAIKYHSHSLDSKSEENQLLDLWAIFETVLDISNKHISDRIQQVCQFLVPLLKHKYIYSLFKQLSDDIKNYNEEIYYQIIGDAVDEFDVVKKVCEFTLLSSESQNRSQLIGKCDDFPLLKERILYYNQKLSTPKDVHSFVEKHAERVQWQIMRIYRNTLEN